MSHSDTSVETQHAGEAHGTVLPYRSPRDENASTALVDILIAVVSAMGGVCWTAFGVASIAAIFIAKTTMDRVYVAISCIVLVPLSMLFARALLREARHRWERVV